ncbi:MAG: hypothetical protein LBT46_00600 [Planctomycetaceae bacterium]|jgi:hypothetical protein|nr:hypothetical protein [Planctomycetaceae bacterium]
MGCCGQSGNRRTVAAYATNLSGMTLKSNSSKDAVVSDSVLYRWSHVPNINKMFPALCAGVRDLQSKAAGNNNVCCGNKPAPLDRSVMNRFKKALAEASDEIISKVKTAAGISSMSLSWTELDGKEKTTVR